jgi:N6-adenosine-specific RNA methylase IME4
MEKCYATILADPPWRYNSPRAIVGNGGRGNKNGTASDIIQVDVSVHYNTMSVEELKALPVQNHVENNAHLYLWTTNSFMVEAHDIAASWGFKPKTILTWVKKQHSNDKVSMKTGYWYRSCTEHIIFAVRGSLRLIGPTVPTAFILPRLPHSIKPDFFYELIETQSPGPYLELFARKSRDKWTSIGEEVDGHNINESLGKEVESTIDFLPQEMTQHLGNLVVPTPQ